MTEGFELPNKETYKYLGILEADNIKQVEKRKIKKNITGERERYSKPNYIAGTL